MSTEETKATGSSSSIDPKLAAFLSYFFTIIAGAIFLAIEKDNKFVRFHAWQSIIFGVAWIVVWVAFMILSAILANIPLIGLLISGLLSLALSIGGLIIWILLIVKSFQGEMYKLPFIGDMAEQRA